MEARRCAICERTLLVGERPVRFAPDGIDEFVDVCPLCQETALDHGWVREGSPIGPAGRQSRRRRPLSLGAIFGGGSRRPAAETIVAEPILRRLSASRAGDRRGRRRSSTRATRLRTVEGIARSLGEPQVSIVPLSGPNPDVVITVSWEISWYQYRITARRDAAGAAGRARASSRASSTPTFTAWNAQLETGLGVVPEIELRSDESGD